MDTPSFEELHQKRKAEEQKLINDLKYKRFCIRGAPTLPSEGEVQQRIRTFIKDIVQITRNNKVLDTFAELYARGEAALYRAKVENVWRRTNHMKECFRSAAEGVAMCYETYKFLLVAESATRKSRDKFSADDIEGLTLDPRITSDYVRREMDFFDEVLSTMQTEMRNAEIQISLEDRPNVMVELKQAISAMKTTVESAVSTLHHQEKGNQEEKMAELLSLIKDIKAEISEIKKSQQATQERLALLEERMATRADSRGKGEEDSQDFDERELTLRGDTETSQFGRMTRRNDRKDGQEKMGAVHLEQRRLEIVYEIERLESMLKANSRVPCRQISYVNAMRAEEEYLRCSFCDEKGKHYSDCCPKYQDVESRRRRICCVNCLDTRHLSDRCKRKIRRCVYCKAETHNKALCDLPEDIEQNQWKLRKLREELEDLEKDMAVTSTSRSAQYHEDRDQNH